MIVCILPPLVLPPLKTPINLSGQKDDPEEALDTKPGNPLPIPHLYIIIISPASLPTNNEFGWSCVWSGCFLVHLILGEHQGQTWPTHLSHLYIFFMQIVSLVPTVHLVYTLYPIYLEKNKKRIVWWWRNKVICK